MYTIQRTLQTGRVQYLAGRDSLTAEFRLSGTSSTGVGVDSLRTWKTQAGAQRWMDQRTGWQQMMEKVGKIEIVEVR